MKTLKCGTCQTLKVAFLCHTQKGVIKDEIKVSPQEQTEFWNRHRENLIEEKQPFSFGSVHTGTKDKSNWYYAKSTNGENWKKYDFNDKFKEVLRK